jgi:hypothetical protein
MGPKLKVRRNKKESQLYQNEFAQTMAKIMGYTFDRAPDCKRNYRRNQIKQFFTKGFDFSVKPF